METTKVRKARNAGTIEVKTLTIGVTQEQVDFLEKMAAEHGVPKWHVVADALDIFIERYAKEGTKCFGVLLNAKSQREAEKAEKLQQREAEKAEKLQPIADELGNLSGVNAKQATGIAEQFRTWNKIANASPEELTEMGVSIKAAAKIISCAATHVAAKKESISAKRSKSGAKRTPKASKELAQYTAEEASEILGITRRKLRQMIEKGELMGIDDEDSVMLPCDIKDIDMNDRLDAAKSVVK